ncbi:glycosyltransferase [uncultured Campylobacter sp.]|uniref:glycosyltransferase n=1 Tax=uncultured Campylobacter sp. TaxID=218934 RepID=UPI00262434F1|nr:glycosyltransferase [uncultured Campylobacter sp.]
MAISVIIPIYNEPDEILRRLCRVLAMQCGELEIIFADASDKGDKFDGENRGARAKLDASANAQGEEIPKLSQNLNRGAVNLNLEANLKGADESAFKFKSEPCERGGEAASERGEDFDLAAFLSENFAPQKFQILKTRKGRGAQMDAGARAAKFENLLFLHADSEFESVNAVARADAVLETCEAGCFTLKFKPSGVLLNLIALGSNLRVNFRNIAFGDQGIFIRKALFQKFGGFENLAIMEDYALSMKLKKAGVKFKRLRERIITSARKFRREGVLSTLLKMQILQYKFRNGASGDEIAKSY